MSDDDFHLPPDIAKEEREHTKSSMTMVAAVALGLLTMLLSFICGVMEDASWAEIIFAAWTSFLVIFVGSLVVFALLRANDEIS
ncbi:MAG: hypothetical protein KGZ30_00815 [Anaplasmataceae bacterium]|nr:hypothetical protein [Anaplasmataceae bacterium]